jgi:hypothetical protein
MAFPPAETEIRPALAAVAASAGDDPSDWRRPVPPAPGPIRFARYAFGPNQLGYCGPDAATELFSQATGPGDLRKLRELAGQFEGAYPYLALIAGSNDRRDPLASDVVQAYWLGGTLASDVRPRSFGDSLEHRFRRRIPRQRWRWLSAAPNAGAAPNHAFHVLDVFPKVGLLRTGEIDRVIETMDSCRIRWGRILERHGDSLVVSAVPLELVDGALRLGSPRIERVRGWIDGRGFVEDVAPGDVISMHWDWACERLDEARLDTLRRSTVAELAIANATL